MPSPHLSASAPDGAVVADIEAPVVLRPLVRPRWKAYVALTKPRIIELLLVTTIPAMILAEGGWPGVSLVLLTLVGGAAAAGSANAYNMILDRDIDRVMNRTKTRPLVTGEITPRQAWIFSTVLGAGSIGWFAAFVNLPAAGLTLGAILLYVIFYTMVLKRRTSQNIVWGGVAGCMPVLIGWVAVTGTLDWAPFVLFLVVFFWTPPHYWPLSMKFKQDYARAGVPMLPVVADDVRVARQIIIYAAVMVACTLALVPLSELGWIYTGVAALAGAWFMVGCFTLLRRVKRLATPGAEGNITKLSKQAAMKLFHGSITYLTVVFLAVAVDPLLPW